MTDGADPDKLLPEQWVDSFKVVKRLGSGSYGVVYQVEKDGQFFALKLARHREASQDERHTDARTRRELACLLVLRHPNIAQVWGHGRWPHPTEGYFYLVIDYVEGLTLAKWAEKYSPTAHELAVLGEKVAAALAHAHSLDIFHRDIKPENILVRTSDGEPVLVDFGAAAFPLGPALTDQQLPPGTPRYTTPQGLRFDREHRHDPAARYEFTATDDIYALGVTLYDVLTDPRLDSRPKYLPVGNWFVPPRSAIHVNERVPMALSQLVDEMIARAPEQRPVSMEKVRRSLAEFTPLKGEDWEQRTLHPPSAQVARLVPPPRATPHLLRRVPRAGAVAGAVSVVAVSVLIVLMLLGLGMLRQGEPGPMPVPPQAPASPGPETMPAASPSPPAPPLSEPAPAEPQTHPPLAPPSPKKGSPVTASGPLSSSSKALCQRTKPPPRGSPGFLAWCKCAAIVGTLTAANAGCSTVPVRPEPGPCPQETLDAMAKAFDGLRTRNRAGYITLGTELEVPKGVQYLALKEGPVTARVIRENHDKRSWGPGLPKGTLLHGYLWTDSGFKGPTLDTGPTGEEYALIRFTSVTTPAGKTYPVCIVAFDADGLAVKHAGSGPGVAVVQQRGYAHVVDEGGWPPPPGPYSGDTQ